MAISPKRFFQRLGPIFLIILGVSAIRFSKGVLVLDIYAFLTRPFWPGSAQKEWLQNSFLIEQKAKIQLLELDNQRLRKMLSLDQSKKNSLISVPVISRTTKGWWQKIELGKGSLNGIDSGDAVLGPGGLLGIVESVTPTTSRVRLLTSPGSRLGVWSFRTKRHGVLVGMGTNRPQLRFLDKDPKVLPGDLISTSPASTLLPPNVPVGVIQVFNQNALPSPNAIIQLTASPEAIDWVQIKKK